MIENNICVYCGTQTKEMRSLFMCNSCYHHRTYFSQKHEPFTACAMCNREGLSKSEMHNSITCKACQHIVNSKRVEANKKMYADVDKKEKPIKAAVKVVPSKKKTLDEISKECREQNITYGQWQTKETCDLLRKGWLYV